MPNAPVERIAVDEPNGKLEPGIGLCLSGGGYRAMIFHLEFYGDCTMPACCAG